MSYCWACNAYHKDMADHAACALERGEELLARKRNDSEAQEEKSK